MRNTKQAVAGQVVRLVEPGGGSNFNMTEGKLYYIYALSEDGKGSCFHDDTGKSRCFWTPSKYVIVGDLDDYKPGPTLKDIQGNEVKVGDTIAYAFAGAQSRHLALFEVLSIPNANVAMCRSKTDGAVINLGVFEERAIKIKE